MNSAGCAAVYYPLFADLRGRRVVVVGGGRVAERKVEALLEAGARIVVVSPEVTETLARMAGEGRIQHVPRPFRPGDLDEAWLVVAATDDPAAQRLAYREAEARRVFCNTVDQPHLCSFIVPAVVRRGDLCLAVSTAGQSPALARRLREDLERAFGPAYGAYVGLVGALRRLLLERGLDAEGHPGVYRDLVAPEVLSWVEAGRWERVARWAEALCGTGAREVVERLAAEHA
ncbi:bifunctional precorrin-2 dehydrogenase/sirohydrochlorin ferrochelatase, partial [Dissulfurirhabdus thermomarina]